MSDEIKKKGHDKFTTITAIISRTSRWFGLVTDMKIYFDTEGHYSHPREAPARSDWEIADESYFGDPFRVFTVSKGKTEASEAKRMLIRTKHGAMSIIGVLDSRYVLRMKRESDTKIVVTFDPAEFDIDDTMFISDSIIRQL